MRWASSYVAGVGGTGDCGHNPDGSGPALRRQRWACVPIMDALPLEEHSGVNHASRNNGLHARLRPRRSQHHAVGRRGRTVAGVTTIISGTGLPGVPARRRRRGRREVRCWRTGCSAAFPMGEIYGLHNWPALPVGRFGLIPGPIMASGDRVDLVIHGRGRPRRPESRTAASIPSASPRN
jgi:hypothetical protein